MLDRDCVDDLSDIGGGGLNERGGFVHCDRTGHLTDLKLRVEDSALRHQQFDVRNDRSFETFMGIGDRVVACRNIRDYEGAIIGT